MTLLEAFSWLWSPVLVVVALFLLAVAHFVFLLTRMDMTWRYRWETLLCWLIIPHLALSISFTIWVMTNFTPLSWS